MLYRKSNTSVTRNPDRKPCYSRMDGRPNPNDFTIQKSFPCDWRQLQTVFRQICAETLQDLGDLMLL